MDGDVQRQNVQRDLADSVRDPQLMRAALALHRNELAIAEPLLKASLKQNPFNVAAMRMLAELAGRIARYQDAEKLLRRALELAPAFTPARSNLAMLLYRTSRLTEALEELAQVALDGGEEAGGEAGDLRAAVLGRLGEFDEALALYEIILEQHPEQAGLWLSYGHVLKTVGRLEDGIAAYRHAIALAPRLGDAWWSLANLKTLRFGDEDVAAMEAALAAPDLRDEDRFHLEFALGKAFEDRGEPARAFARYADANRHRRALIHYDSASIHSASQRAGEAFTPAYFAARQGHGCPAPDPIFIVGMPRAGSTLVEQILASHSAVEPINELPDIPMLWNALGSEASGNDPLAACLALGAQEARQLGEDYLARVAPQRKTSRPFFIDKLPNNWRYIGFIKTILPNAKIIDARRHPLSCGFSNFKQHYARGQNFSYDLEDIGHYYKDHVELMASFEVAVPGGIHRVIYERMVADTSGEIRALLAALGLPFEPACLAFHQTERAVRTPSSEQVRSAIFRSGTENWQAYEPWLGPLKSALGEVLEAYLAIT